MLLFSENRERADADAIKVFDNDIESKLDHYLAKYHVKKVMSRS